jgi:hypothetical protein
MARKNKRNNVRPSPPSRREQKREEKLRRIGTTAALAFLAASLIAGVLFTLWGVRAVLFSRNRHFTLADIEVLSDGRLEKPQVVAYLADLGIVPGESNLFALDLADIRRQMRSRNVLVADVRLYRKLPDTLRVRVFEPHPVARLANNMLLDREGLVLPGSADPWAGDLPVVTGFRGAGSVSSGDVIEEPMVEAALFFLTFTRTDPSGEFLVPSLIQPDYTAKALKVCLRSKGPFREEAWLTIPADRDKIPLALARVDTIVRERYRARQPIGTMNATWENNIAVLP